MVSLLASFEQLRHSGLEAYGAFYAFVGDRTSLDRLAKENAATAGELGRLARTLPPPHQQLPFRIVSNVAYHAFSGELEIHYNLESATGRTDGEPLRRWFGKAREFIAGIAPEALQPTLLWLKWVPPTIAPPFEGGRVSIDAVWSVASDYARASGAHQAGPLSMLLVLLRDWAEDLDPLLKAMSVDIDNLIGEAGELARHENDLTTFGAQFSRSEEDVRARTTTRALPTSAWTILAALARSAGALEKLLPPAESILETAEGLAATWEPTAQSTATTTQETASEGTASESTVERPSTEVTSDAWTDPDHRSKPPLRYGNVEWLTDSPTSDDLLKRKPLAHALAERLRRIQADERSSGTSFLVHVDGPWGSGKSTLLEFLREDLDDEWLVVPFDAWRQSRVGPPWWALLTRLRHDLSRSLDRRGRFMLRINEVRERARRAGAPYVVGLVLLIVLAVGLFFVLRPADGGVAGLGDVAKSVSAIAAALVTLWAGTIVVGKFLLWDSAAGARFYEQSHQNPMESLAAHFAWLVQAAGKPVVFFIDDLDRCDETYVVDLLESVQTLIRDVPERLTGRPRHQAPYFVVTADGSWLRRSYEGAYGDFENAVGQPGRPLGYLFLDKVFQLTVPVPWISGARQESYLGDLLGLQERAALDSADERFEVEQRVRASTTRTEAVAAVSGASADVRKEVAPVLVEKLNEADVVRTTEHTLMKFATLLEPNPRAIKRFLNAFAIADSVLVLEDIFVERDSLALWTILRVRWPALADFLQTHPDVIDDLASARPASDNVPPRLASLFGAPEVAAIVSCEDGGPLNAELVRRCSGIAVKG